jgi:toxin ParE1/3/4
LLNKAKRYELTPKAFADLEDIWRCSAEAWSVAQADHHIDDFSRSFEMLAQTPEIARLRREFNPSVRIHIHQEQAIVYLWHEDLVTIIRILGGKQNWRGGLQVLEE